jgi:hypothetical protein
MAERDSAWIKERLAGKKLEEIAREYTAATGKKCSRQHVAIAIGKHLTALTQEPAEELRSLESQRLDELQAAYWTNALLGDMQAALFVLRVLESRRKLFGLDVGAKAGAAANVSVEVGVGVQSAGPVDLTLEDVRPLLEAAGLKVVPADAPDKPALLTTGEDAGPVVAPRKKRAITGGEHGNT